MTTDPTLQQRRLEGLLSQAIERRPYLNALALVAPGGRLLAAVLPPGVEPESIAAMAAPAALLGRRIALEQLEGDMRQVYVEGEGGYVILRAIGKAAILLAVAVAEANLALVLHDVLQLEGHVAAAIGAAPGAADQWAVAVPAIERLRRLAGQIEPLESPPERLADLRDKLRSLDLGYFPERVSAIQQKLEAAAVAPGTIEEIEAELLALERDVMAQVGPPVPAFLPEGEAIPAAAPRQTAIEQAKRPRKERIDTRGSWIRRALRWLASMIASED